LPSLYRSTATVLVERQQVPEAFVRPTVTSALLEGTALFAAVCRTIFVWERR